MLRRLFYNFWYLFRRPPWDSGISSLSLTQREEGMTPGPMARPSTWFTFTQS